MQTLALKERRETEDLRTEIRFIDIDETLRQDDVDLRTLVSHRTAVGISDTLGVGSNHSYCPQRPATGRVYLSATLKLSRLAIRFHCSSVAGAS